MTLVNVETGELVETLTRDSAQRLTDRIRLLGGSLADTLDKMAGLIGQARTGSAWLALGYRSWTEYVAEEFADVLPRLDREPRQEFVRELSSQGMSTRAIAPIVGVTHKTVVTDLHSGGTAGTTSAPASAEASEPLVTGLDGKQYRPPAPRAPETALGEYIDSDTSVQDSRYIAALTKHLRDVAAVHQFDPDRVADLADDLVIQTIDAAFDNFTRWRDRIGTKRSDLRVIKGGAQ